MTHFVFCHGFGFDTHFWDRLAPYFSQERCSFMDLGYFNHQLELPSLHHQPLIGIGHSIGLSKLVSMSSKFDYLIGLNGFVNFLGSDQVVRKKRQREIKALRASFLRAPESTLKSFYTRCGADELIAAHNLSHLNLNLVLSDLQWLEKEYTLPEVATLILSSEDDIVVPQSITSDNFSEQPWVKQECIMEAKHALGFRKSAEVYEKIMSFLNDRAA